MVEADQMPVIQTLSEGQRGIEDQKRKEWKKEGDRMRVHRGDLTCLWRHLALCANKHPVYSECDPFFFVIESSRSWSASSF